MSNSVAGWQHERRSVWGMGVSNRSQRSPASIRKQSGGAETNSTTTCEIGRPTMSDCRGAVVRAPKKRSNSDCGFEAVRRSRNPGQTWCQEADRVNDHDFPGDAKGRATPYGIYDPERNEGHVCVTTSSDTPDLAVDAIQDWWGLKQPDYPKAKRLMIEADSGGS